MLSTMLPEPYQRRVLGDLDRLIALAERDPGRRPAPARRPAAGSRPELAERRLALLRRSRELLLGAELAPEESVARRRPPEAPRLAA